MNGLALDGPFGRVTLKWHKCRDVADRPAHCRESLALGLSRGAMLEVDLQTTADGHWVCLHDDTLDAETSGEGVVGLTPRAGIERLFQRANDGTVLDDRVLFLDELVAIVSEVPRGRVQLDIKAGGTALTAEAREHFECSVAPHAARFEIGGHDAALVRCLAGLAPGIRPGFDPCDRFTGANIDRWREFIETVPADAAPMLYLHHDAVTRAAEAGIDLIAHARSRGQVVDCWTIDPANGDTAAILARMVSLGAGRITTNDPIALEALWHAIPSSERPAG
ncbi:MAG: glycerophosphodiester phosphodiesterase family protein [Geminicoccaceae bacterium]